MYRGQLLQLKRNMLKKDFEGVRVAAVDDFQGEENDIILLSLVRSNSEGKIGFIGNSNRICVSLSRAKKGFFVVGNLTMLRDKDRTIWPEIISELDRWQCVGSGLPLHCRIHAERKIFAEKPEDFLKCPEGGCDKFCNTRLPCGHRCPRVCHPKNMNHSNYNCPRVCAKRLPCGHECKRKCYECSLGCDPCSHEDNKVLPLCGHTVSVPCSSNPATISCPILCGKTLRCGHACQNTCSEPCNLKCYVKVEKELECEHKCEAFCYQAQDEIRCKKKCVTILECGHSCEGTCDECDLGRLHIKCNLACGRNLSCGHTCDYPCDAACPPCMQPCGNFCVHSRCPKKCYELCDPCMELCQWSCQHYRCTQYCGELCDRPQCDRPCNKVLKCGHNCIGLCGEKCPDLCRVCNRDEVCDAFFGSKNREDAMFIVLEDCGHLFEVNGLDYMISKVDIDLGETKLFSCPKCNTPVRKTRRYFNKVKQILQNIEETKKKQLVSVKDIELEIKFSALFNRGSYHHDLPSEISLIKHALTQDTLHPYRAKTILAQVSILTHIVNIKRTIEPYNLFQLKSKYTICHLDYILDNLERVMKFVMQTFLSEQQISDAIGEIRRISCAAKLSELLHELLNSDCKLTQDEKDELDRFSREVYESGWKCPTLCEENKNAIETFVTDVSTKWLD